MHFTKETHSKGEFYNIPLSPSATTHDFHAITLRVLHARRLSEPEDPTYEYGERYSICIL
jgi:hypothetical protein